MKKKLLTAIILAVLTTIGVSIPTWMLDGFLTAIIPSAAAALVPEKAIQVIVLPASCVVPLSSGFVLLLNNSPRCTVGEGLNSPCGFLKPPIRPLDVNGLPVPMVREGAISASVTPFLGVT